MNDKQLDEIINRALRDEKELPEGLSERLEKHIDLLAANEKQTVKRSLLNKSKQTIYWISGIAAAMLIGIALFFQTETYEKPTLADTFSNPEEAALVAQDLLVFMSQQLNKGLEPLEDAQKNVQEINEILNTQFNE